MVGALFTWRTCGIHWLKPLRSSVWLNGQRRTLVHKSILKHDENACTEPWPYKIRGYNWVNAAFDRTMKRLHENSKLIVVEGNIGSGKGEVARKLADELGFYFIPEFQMEEVIIDRFGNDYRDYYHLMPKKFRLPDMNMFYENPSSDMTAVMRERIIRCKFDQYLNAVAHILNTGQGVVLENTPHTDFVFANALRAKNYIGPEYFMYYFFQRKGMVPSCHFWPHIVLYIDAPIDMCLENIRKEGNMKRTEVEDRLFLQTIEDSYKDALREFKKHSEILVYDWTKPVSVGNIAEDMEDLDLDFYEQHQNDLFSEWLSEMTEYKFTTWRVYVTNKRDAHVKAFANLPQHECGELFQSPREFGLYLQVIHNEILKSPYIYSAIKGNNDKIGYLSKIMNRLDSEPWFEYYYKDTYLDEAGSIAEFHGDPKHKGYHAQMHSHH